MKFEMKLKGIEAELERVRKQINSTKLQIVEKKCKQMLNELVEATPVDTGKARDSWNITHTGNPSSPAIISNEVPYISRLNEGSSKQAPAHFVERIALKFGKPVGQIVQVRDPDRP